MAGYPNVENPEENKGRSKRIIGCSVAVVVTLCVVLFVVVGGYAGIKAFLNDEIKDLTIETQSPTSQVDTKQLFDISVILSNVGKRNVTITGVQLPTELLNVSTVKQINPVNELSENASIPGNYILNLLIAPNGQQTITFSMEAITPASISGNIEVSAGDKSGLSEISVAIVPAAVSIEEEPTLDPNFNAAIPYQSVVEIIAVVDLEGELIQAWNGSGTVISEDGLILTNAHVVLSDRYYTVVDLIVAITEKEDQPPVKMFYADILQADANVDLAVIKIRSDLFGNPVDFSTYGIPPVPLGDSHSIKLGDPIIIIGYPVIGGQTITLTKGEVSGFTAEEPYGNRAFIKTSATITGGNSGGLAATMEGKIIGVPTQMGSGEDDLRRLVDCRRLVDTNRDGIIDEKDSCVPTGGFINALRPVHLALPFIEAAKRGEISIVEYAPEESQEEYEPEGEVILFDEFNDNSNNWALGDLREGRVSLSNGRLTIDVYETNQIVWTILPEDYEEVILGVDITPINPVGDGDFGFVCGYQDDSNLHVLEISEDGYYIIYKFVDDEYDLLVDWTYSDIIAEGNPYSLAAYCGPDRLALGLNGTLLVETVDPDYIPGKIGLVGGIYQNPNLRVGFDNFLIMLP